MGKPFDTLDIIKGDYRNQKMRQYNKEELEGLEKIFRINLINSITGIKPANLIGTIDSKKNTNLAIISSIVHLGSNPGFIGFIMRPTAEIRRHTYQNILEKEYYTINHVSTEWIDKAHYTSAKFDKEVSEFDACKLRAEFKDEFIAPYVGESPIQIGMRLAELIEIKSNGTTMIVGNIEHIYIRENLITENGFIDLESSSSAGISGLNSYYKMTKLESFPYARVEELPSF